MPFRFSPFNRLSDRARPPRLAPFPFLAIIAVALSLGVVFPPGPVVGQVSGEPRVVEMDERPVLKNPGQAEEMLDRFYPATMKEAGIEGTAEVWIRIDELGRTRETRLKETSGHVALDEAAERVAGLMSFQPATRDGAAIAVWIPMNINFRLPGAAASAGSDAADAEDAPVTPVPGAPPMAEPEIPAEDPMRIEPPPRQEPSLESGPQFTPMTVAPELQNGQEVSRALAEHYPPMLRDAGIGATVNVWLFIDENGVVQKTQINESSGYDAFDEAALEVARIMRFSPAYNRDEKARVWVALDITFSVE